MCHDLRWGESAGVQSDWSIHASRPQVRRISRNPVRFGKPNHASRLQVRTIRRSPVGLGQLCLTTSGEENQQESSPTGASIYIYASRPHVRRISRSPVWFGQPCVATAGEGGQQESSLIWETMRHDLGWGRSAGIQSYLGKYTSQPQVGRISRSPVCFVKQCVITSGEKNELESSLIVATNRHCLRLGESVGVQSE